MRSIFSVTVVFSLLVNPLLAQDEAAAIRRQLRKDLSNGWPGEIVAPISVIRELSYKNATTSDYRDLHTIAMRRSPFAQLAGADAYVKKVQADIFTVRQQVIEESLQQMHSSPTLANLVSFTSDRSFAGLQKDLQKAAAIDLKSFAALQDRLKSVQATAVGKILKDFDTAAQRKEAVAAAQKASVQIQQLLSKRFLQQSDINALEGEGKIILGILNDKVPAALAKIPDTDALIRGHYQDLANLSKAISQQVTAGVAPLQLPKLTPELSANLLQSLGAIGNAHASLVHVLEDKDGDGRNFGDKLADGMKQLDSQWEQLPKNLTKIDPQTQAFLTGFKGLVGNLNGISAGAKIDQ